MQNIGIFIDGENINPKDYSYIFEEISSLGRIIVSRVYADWSSSITEKWNSLAINYALEMIHCAKLPRKNSVDIRIIDDIYEFLYETQTIDKYYLISTDADFITPARRVRRKGKEFYGVGYSNSSVLLKNVCDKFIPIEMLRKDNYYDETPPKNISKKKRVRRVRRKKQNENLKKNREKEKRDNDNIIKELEELKVENLSSSYFSDEDEDEEEEEENCYTCESCFEDEEYDANEKEISEILEELVDNSLPVNSLEYLEPLFPRGLRYIRIKNLYSIITEKRKDFKLTIDEFKEELEKNDKLLVIPNKFDKLTVYNMSSLNDDNSSYLKEQIDKIIEKNDNKMIISALKETLEKQTLIFDQRIWGFSKIKEFLKICFPNKYKFNENEIILAMDEEQNN